MRSDLTPIKDPRNAVGMLTDVLRCVTASRSWAAKMAHDDFAVAMMTTACTIGGKFTKAPRTILNGYQRPGYARFYQQVKAALQPVDTAPVRGSFDAERVGRGQTLHSLASHVLTIVQMSLESVENWEKYNRETREISGQVARIIEPPWLKTWSDHVDQAHRLGADLEKIRLVECGWRFRDLTDRSHRGGNTRAAFEAAWLAGHYKFAKQLITEATK